LSSTEESIFLLLHHPLRLGQFERLIDSRDGKNGVCTVEEEENSLLSPSSDMYSIAFNSQRVRFLREGS
jgi:hypothetical protein